jgi:tRNA G18 (ribose-2'-O)-methylase SpoU
VNLERIADAADPRLADYRGVRDPEWLRTRGLFLAEGRGVVRILVGARDFRARSVVVTEAALAAVGEALETLGDATPVYLVTSEVLLATSGVRFHQGCVAVAERERAPSLEEVLAGAGRVALALEDVVNPDNVGGLFRNAFAFGAGGVLLTARCASPLYRKAIRTSLGATLRLPFAVLHDWPRDLERLRAAGFTRIALTPGEGARDLAEVGACLGLPPRVALLVGHEYEGLSPAALAGADLLLRIPRARPVDSINLAAASAIALERLHEIAARR